MRTKHGKSVVMITVALAAALASACDGTIQQQSSAIGTSVDPVTGAAFSTVNEAVDGSGHCQNGNPNINCNLYSGKQYVWLNGGPSTAYVGDGTYFFAVLEPGGQPNPNDGGPKNLSDDFDAYANRTFSVSGGTITYAGTHDFADNKIRLMPYADTSNPGGVYILAICSLGSGYPVAPRDCKYDAFKVKEAVVPPAVPLTISKTACGASSTIYSWSIAKDGQIEQNCVDPTLSYTVTLTHDDGIAGEIKVSGTISVVNPNSAAVAISGIVDELSDGTVCSVTGGGAQSLAPGQTDFAYECLLAALPCGALDNVVTVSWLDQQLAGGAQLAAGSASFTYQGISFSDEQVDECVDVGDSYAGDLGTVCVGDANPKVFTYQRNVTAPTSGCECIENIASFKTNDTGVTGSATKDLSVCAPGAVSVQSISPCG